MSKKKETARAERTTVNILKDDELKFFYEKILLFYEDDNRKGYGDFDQIKRKIKKAEGLQIFDFVYDDYKEKMKDPQDNTFYFSAESDNGEGHSKVCKKLFGHIRNAFAHNYITKEKGCIILRDFETPKLASAQTLYVKLTSFDEFKKLIEFIQKEI